MKSLIRLPACPLPPTIGGTSSMPEPTLGGCGIAAAGYVVEAACCGCGCCCCAGGCRRRDDAALLLLRMFLVANGFARPLGSASSLGTRRDGLCSPSCQLGVGAARKAARRALRPPVVAARDHGREARAAAGLFGRVAVLAVPLPDHRSAALSAAAAAATAAAAAAHDSSSLAARVLLRRLTDSELRRGRTVRTPYSSATTAPSSFASCSWPLDHH